MQRMIEATDPSKIRTSWERVFRSNDPFAWPFQPDVTTGRIFYPTDGYHLTQPQFSAVMEASKRTGESGFFISIVESEGLSFLERSGGHWICENPSYQEYSQLPLALENAIFSKCGRWGVLISHEMHALIAGRAELMAALDEEYRGWDGDLDRLREAWADNPNAAWLEPIAAACSFTARD